MDPKPFAMTSSFQIHPPVAAPETPRHPAPPPDMVVAPKKWTFPSLSCQWKKTPPQTQTNPSPK